jgi:sulfonate transport system substrate-binding protein
VQIASQARVLRDGKGLVDNVAYYIGARDFARTQPAVVDTILAEIASTGAWANERRGEVVDLLAPALGIAKEALDLSLSRSPFGVRPVGDDLLASQQRIADAFHDLELIPNRIRTADGRWERAVKTARR